MKGHARRYWLFVLAPIVATAVPPAGTASAATPPDPSKLTASCFASDSPTGAFSPTNPVTVWAGSPLELRLGYRNDDANADPAYFAHFTARIADSVVFGPAHTIDTSTHLGGQGIRTGTVRGVQLATTVPATERVVIEVTSDETGSTVLATCDFALTVRQLNEDLDGDGISNDLELNGLRDSAGNLVMTAAGTPAGDFPALGANPCRKDLFVQLGYQGPAADGHEHRPNPTALARVEQAFANAPVPGVVGGCPFAGHSASGGVHLRFDLAALPAETVTTNPNGTTSITPVDCGNLPLAAFDVARRPYFVYSVWVHQSAANSQSGLGPCGVRSFIVSLGLWSGGNGTVADQAGTFMHELGHTLGLGHGGNDPVNLKPNYLSVMNYSFQAGVPDAGGVAQPDYSGSALPTLDEALLDETAGVQGPASKMTRWWGPQPKFRFSSASSPYRAANSSLDWNQNGAIDGGTVSVDVNSDGQCVGPGPNGLRDTTPAADDVVSSNEVWNGTNRICDSRPSGDDTTAPQPTGSWCVRPGQNGTFDSAAAGDDALVGVTLMIGANLVCDTTASGDDVQFVSVGRTESRLFGFNDWAAIDWRIGPTRTQPGPSIELPPVQPHAELTLEKARAIDAATVPSTHFDLETRTRVDAADVLPGDTLTFTSTVANVGTATATGVRLVETLPNSAQVTRTLPDLAPGQMTTETFTYTVPFPIADGTILTGTARASGVGPTGTPEEELNNNSASSMATARSARCATTGVGALAGSKKFAYHASPWGSGNVGVVAYADVRPGAHAVLASVQITGIACFNHHARLFGKGIVNGSTNVAYRLDVDDLGPGLDRFAISWPGYVASGVLAAGDVKVIP